MINFLKRSSLEVFLLFLIGLGLVRLSSLRDQLNLMAVSINKLEKPFIQPKQNERSLLEAPKVVLKSFEGKYCSQMDDTFVIANFEEEGKNLIVKWMDLNREKLYGSYKTYPKIVMGKLTIYVRHHSGEEQNYLFTQIELDDGVVKSFSVGGGLFNRELCQ